MKWSELILLAGLTIFAGVLLKDSFSLPYNSGGGFGPGFIPLNFAVVTILLVGVLGAQSYLRNQATDSESDKDIRHPESSAVFAPVATMVMLFAATFVMELGSVLAPLAVVITIVSTVFLKQSWIKSAALTVITLTAIYAIFSLWLNIPVI